MKLIENYRNLIEAISQAINRKKYILAFAMSIIGVVCIVCMIFANVFVELGGLVCYAAMSLDKDWASETYEKREK